MTGDASRPPCSTQSVSAAVVSPASTQSAASAAISAYRPKQHTGTSGRWARSVPMALRAIRVAVCIGTEKAMRSAQATASSSHGWTARSSARTSWPRARSWAAGTATCSG